MSDADVTRADDYRARTAEARERLTALLDPKTEQEREVVAQLGEHLDLQHLLALAELIECHQAH